MKTQRHGHAASLDLRPAGGGIDGEQPERPAGIPLGKRKVGGAHRLSGAIHLGHTDLVLATQPVDAGQLVIDALGRHRCLGPLVCLHAKLDAIGVAGIRNGRQFAVAFDHLANRLPIGVVRFGKNLIGQAMLSLELELYRFALGQRDGVGCLRPGRFGLGDQHGRSYQKAQTHHEFGGNGFHKG